MPEQTDETEPTCLNEGDGSSNCSDSYNCCDCGGNNCGCCYCFSCNACEVCNPPEEIKSENS